MIDVLVVELFLATLLAFRTGSICAGGGTLAEEGADDDADDGGAAAGEGREGLSPLRMPPSCAVPIMAISPRRGPAT